MNSVGPSMTLSSGINLGNTFHMAAFKLYENQIDWLRRSGVEEDNAYLMELMSYKEEIFEKNFYLRQIYVTDVDPDDDPETDKFLTYAELAEEILWKNHPSNPEYSETVRISLYGKHPVYGKHPLFFYHYVLQKHNLIQYIVDNTVVQNDSRKLKIMQSKHKFFAELYEGWKRNLEKERYPMELTLEDFIRLFYNYFQRVEPCCFTFTFSFGVA